MPTDLLRQFTDAIGSFFDNEAVQLGLRAIFVYVVILWLAAAYWAFRDMQARTENPILPYLGAALIILFTPLLFPFAVVVYRIVRPQERLGEVYERNLAEEALLAEVEAIHTCPGCARRTHDDWIICPTCRTRLNRVCPNCGRLVGLDWSLCAFCGKDFERPEPALERAAGTERTGAPAGAGQPIEQPRRRSPQVAVAPELQARPVRVARAPERPAQGS
ncbi:MAG TPA: zinc ribbon domain-containing protein [Candidatus Limnocylindrales bacterium]